MSWGLSKTLDAEIPIVAVYDRDYFCDEQITEIYQELSSELKLACIHKRKEIENYLLVPSILERVLDKAIKERERRSQTVIEKKETARNILDRITDQEKTSIQAQYIARRIDFLKKTGKDAAPITTETIHWFDKKWKGLNERMEIVPGKQILRMLRDEVQTLYCVNLTDIRIIDEFTCREVPDDLVTLIENLEAFRISR